MKHFSTSAYRAFALDRFASAFIIVLVALVLSSAIYFGQSDEQLGAYVDFQNPLKPSYIYFLTYAFGGIVAMARALRGAALPRGGFIFLLVALGIMHLAWVPFAKSDEETSRSLMLRLNVVVMTICCQIVFSSVKDMTGVLRAVRVVVWVTCLLNLIVTLTPDIFGIRMGIYAGRAAGLYWDPNQCATFLAMLLPLINVGLRRSRRMAQGVVVLAGILFTFSREGVILWVAALLLSEVMRPGELRPRQKVRNTLLVGFFAVLTLLLIWVSWGELVDALRPYLNSDTYARLSGGDEGSTSERLLVLKAGWDMFTANPLFGAGYGATRTWTFGVSVHNMFVLFLAEFGLVGGLWYLAFLTRTFALPLRFGAVLGSLVTIESFFTHSYFDLFYYMLLVLLYWRFAQLLAAKHADGRGAQSPERQGSLSAIPA